MNCASSESELQQRLHRLDDEFEQLKTKYEAEFTNHSNELQTVLKEKDEIVNSLDVRFICFIRIKTNSI